MKLYNDCFTSCTRKHSPCYYLEWSDGVWELWSLSIDFFRTREWSGSCTTRSADTYGGEDWMSVAIAAPSISTRVHSILPLLRSMPSVCPDLAFLSMTRSLKGEIGLFRCLTDRSLVDRPARPRDTLENEALASNIVAIGLECRPLLSPRLKTIAAQERVTNGSRSLWTNSTHILGECRRYHGGLAAMGGRAGISLAVHLASTQKKPLCVWHMSLSCHLTAKQRFYVASGLF